MHGSWFNPWSGNMPQLKDSACWNKTRCSQMNKILKNNLMLNIWPSDVKSQLIGKDPDIGKDWRQKEKRAAEDKLDDINGSKGMNLRKLQETVKGVGAWHDAVCGVSKSQTWLSNWTATTANLYVLEFSMDRIWSLISGLTLTTCNSQIYFASPEKRSGYLVSTILSDLMGMSTKTEFLLILLNWVIFQFPLT